MSTNNANEWNTLLRGGFNALRDLGGNVVNKGKQYMDATAQEIDDVLGKGTVKLIEKGQQAANNVKKTVQNATEDVQKAANKAKDKVTQGVNQGKKEIANTAKKAAKNQERLDAWLGA